MKNKILGKTMIIGLVILFIGASVTVGANIDKRSSGPYQSTDIVWEENFDSYDLGSSMHGQGGWKGWDDNPDATGYVTDVQAQSPPHSVEIAWFGDTAADLIHEFTGVSSAEWTFTAYQYIPSDFSGETYFLLLNTYNDGGPYHWSNAVSFSSDTGEVSSWEGETLLIIFDQWVEIRVEINFSADWQEIYYDDDLLVEKSWTEGIEPGGVLNLACVDLYASDAPSTSVYYDDFSLDGVATDPDLDCDGTLSWIDVEPSSTVEGNFTVENVGAPGSELSWEIEYYPSWGTWTFNPESGTGLTPEDDAITVDVEVVAPEDPETDFQGEVKIVNSENENDYVILQVSLSTPVSQHSQFHIFIQRIIEHFPILQILLSNLFK